MFCKSLLLSSSGEPTRHFDNHSHLQLHPVPAIDVVIIGGREGGGSQRSDALSKVIQQVWNSQLDLKVAFTSLACDTLPGLCHRSAQVCPVRILQAPATQTLQYPSFLPAGNEIVRG